MTDSLKRHRFRSGSADHRAGAVDHLPTMEKVEIKMTGGRVVVGCGPDIVAEGTATSIGEIAKAIENSDFSRITKILTFNYVSNYSTRILAPTVRIELPFIMSEMMKRF